MKRLLVFLVFIALLFSCTQGKQNAMSLEDLHGQIIKVLADNSSTAAQIQETFRPYLDSLSAAARDTNALDRRLIVQKWGYQDIQLLMMKYGAMAQVGTEVSAEGMNAILEPLSDAINFWLYRTGDSIPAICRDHYFVAYQDSDKPVESVLHIEVILPSLEGTSPQLRVFFPSFTKEEPAIVFTDNPADDLPDSEMVSFDEWHLVRGEESYGIGGEHFVQEMLHHDNMYIIFGSQDQPDGTPGETEIIRIQLAPFYTKWANINKG